MTRHLATLRALLSPEPTGVKTISQPGFNHSHRYIVVEPDPLPLGLGVGCGSLQCQFASITAPQKTFVRGWSADPFGAFLAVGRCREGRTPPHIQTYDPLNSRVIVTPAVYPRLFEFLHFDIQSTGQKSHCVNTTFWPSQCYVLIRQSDSPCPYQF